MSLTTAFENDVMELFFLNNTIELIGDATGIVGSTADGNFYIALFSSDPGEGGSPTGEGGFGAYARQAVPRTAAGFTVTGDTVTNAAIIEFPEATSGSVTISHFAICRAGTSGVSDYIMYGALTTPRLVETGTTLEFAIGALSVSVN